METTAIGKSFMQNQIKSRKYFSAHQQNRFFQRNKKRDSKERY